MAGGTVKQIGKTKSICPECLKVISADKVQRNDGIYYVRIGKKICSL